MSVQMAAPSPTEVAARALGQLEALLAAAHVSCTLASRDGRPVLYATAVDWGLRERAKVEVGCWRDENGRDRYSAADAGDRPLAPLSRPTDVVALVLRLLSHKTAMPPP
jgi:hypothetical protein